MKNSTKLFGFASRMIYIMAFMPVISSAQDSLFHNGRYFKPMPFPAQNLNPDTTIDNTKVVSYDIATRTETVLEAPAELFRNTTMPGHEGIFKGSGIAELDPARSFSSMSLVNDLTDYPASANAVLFLYPGTQCTGALIDPLHVLTAGHCVFDDETNEWIDEMEIAPAYDQGINDGFGNAWAVNFTSFQGWTQNGLWEYDMAIVTLDRPIGSLTGWYGFGYNTSNSYFTTNNFDHYSYPGDPPYNGEYMYYRQGDFDSPQTEILYHNDESWGGQSGSSVIDEDYITYSCLSHGNSTLTGHTRITSGKFNVLVNVIDENTPSTPDLIPLNTTAYTNAVESGGYIDYVDFLLHNYSSASFTGTIEVEYYLSFDQYITPFDELLGTETFDIDGLGDKNTMWISLYSPLNIPSYLTPGQYYLGVRVTNDDYNPYGNFTFNYDTHPLTVICTTPPEPLLDFSGDITVCSNQGLTITVIDNYCSQCEIWWSTGESGPSITAYESGTYTAVYYNPCGELSPISVPVNILFEDLPDAPQIIADGSTQLCEGETVTLYAENVCQGCNVFWSNGEWSESIVVDFADTYTAYAYNTCGTSYSSNAIPVDVVSEPWEPTISTSGPTSLCSGESVTLTASNICLGCIVTWSNGQTGNSIIVSNAGTYSATSGNMCGQSFSSNSISITVGSGPSPASVSANGPLTLCGNQNVTLTAQNVCSGCNVQWSNGQTGNSITVTNAGSYSAIVSNSCGQSLPSNTIVITTGSAPMAPGINANGPTSICEGENVTLSAFNICSNCNVLWSDGQTGSTISVSNPGTYTAYVSNDCGQSPTSNSIVITTSPDPTVPVIAANGSTTLCEGGSVILSAGNICANCTITWSNGETGNSITVSLDGNYTAYASNNCGVSPSSNTIVINTSGIFVPEIQVNAICHLAAPVGTNYQWYLNGAPIAGATGQFWDALFTGYYTVSLTGPSGCQGISNPLFAQPCGVSTNESIKDANLIIYPNPASQWIFLELNSSLTLTDVRIELYALNGQFKGELLHADHLANHSTYKIDLPDLAPGMYIYRLSSGEGMVQGKINVN